MLVFSFSFIFYLIFFLFDPIEIEHNPCYRFISKRAKIPASVFCHMIFVGTEDQFTMSCKLVGLGGLYKITSWHVGSFTSLDGHRNDWFIHTSISTWWSLLETGFDCNARDHGKAFVYRWRRTEPRSYSLLFWNLFHCIALIGNHVQLSFFKSFFLITSALISNVDWSNSRVIKLQKEGWCCISAQRF